MEEALLIQKAIEEIETKTWGITEQFLEVHEIAYEDGKPKIARIDYEKKDVAAIIYFNVKGERFYFAIYFHYPDHLSITSICVEPYNAAYLKVSSEHLSLPALKAMTILKPLREGNKGDLTLRHQLVKKYSYMHIEPNPEADELEDKLEKLLNVLEQDREGVTKLINEANAFIQVAIIFHNGNTMLGGPTIDKNTMKRIAALNLEIGFDLYAEGNLFKD